MDKARRDVLKTVLLAAVVTATPQSRLLAASRGGTVELPLADGNRLEVEADKVFAVVGGRRRRADGTYKLESGGRVEIADGVIVGASNAGGPVHVECVWIEFADEKKSRAAKVAAHKYLVSNGGASLSHAGVAQAYAAAC